MRRSLLASFVSLAGVITPALAQCVIPDEPLSNNIPETEGFSIYVQNPALPAIHNRVMQFVRNGIDRHLVLSPVGEPTYDLMFLENGYLRFAEKRGVIDLEVGMKSPLVVLYLVSDLCSTTQQTTRRSSSSLTGHSTLLPLSSRRIAVTPMTQMSYRYTCSSCLAKQIQLFLAERLVSRLVVNNTNSGTRLLETPVSTPSCLPAPLLTSSSAR